MDMVWWGWMRCGGDGYGVVGMDMVWWGWIWCGGDGYGGVGMDAVWWGWNTRVARGAAGHFMRHMKSMLARDQIHREQLRRMVSSSHVVLIPDPRPANRALILERR